MLVQEGQGTRTLRHTTLNAAWGLGRGRWPGLTTVSGGMFGPPWAALKCSCLSVSTSPRLESFSWQERE